MDVYIREVCAWVCSREAVPKALGMAPIAYTNRMTIPKCSAWDLQMCDSNPRKKHVPDTVPFCTNAEEHDNAKACACDSPNSVVGGTTLTKVLYGL